MRRVEISTSLKLEIYFFSRMTLEILISILVIFTDKYQLLFTFLHYMIFNLLILKEETCFSF